MSSFNWPPSGSGGVPVYATFGSFPAGTTSGDLAVDASTGNLYEWSGAVWRQIGGPASALSLGNLDAQAGTAKGAALVAGVLSMQSASVTVPGLVNITTQSFAGNKTFTGTITASNLSGTNTGDLTLAAVGAAPNANAASLSGQILNLQPANGSFPGVVTTAAQTFAGDKSFSNTILVGGSATASGSANIRTQGDGLFQGLNLESSDGSHVLGMVQRTSGDIFFWTGSQIIYSYTGGTQFVGTGNIGAAYKWDVTVSDANTVVTAPDAVAVSAVRNADSTNGNFSTLGFGNVATLTSGINGVNDSHAGGAQTGHLSFITKNLGVMAERATLDATGLVLVGTITASNFSGSSSGSNTGDVTLTAVGASPSANGASLSGQALTLQPADATNPGLVTTGAQTFAGVKTFSSAPLLSSLSASQAVVTDASKNLASLAYTSANTPTTIVERDGSGNFSAGTITASLTGTASGNEVPLTFSTGLTRTVNTVTVNTSQNIATLSNLTTNGFVTTSGGAGTLGVQTSPLTVAQTTVATQAIGASAIDWSTGNVFTKTLGASTTFTFSNQTSGQTIVVRLTNTASNWTVTWPAVKWAGGSAPTMTVGAFSDVYTFVYDGTNTYGSAVQNMS